MIAIKKFLQFLVIDTYGNIALGSFLICAVSGIFLAIPYDVSNAYDSIALMLITNMPAVIFRNMHYWSAQFFLLFTLLHTLEHYRKKTAANLSHGVWVRLVFSLVFVFFVMLSGFILKGDADSTQAFRILETLVVRLPLGGNFLADLVFGGDEGLQLLYVHHIATATIFLIYVVVEHARTLWVKRTTFLLLLAVFTLLSFVLHAPLHDNINPILKGPWYFVGLQEILHWTGRPEWSWLLVLGLLVLVYLSYFDKKLSGRIKYKLLILTLVLYGILTIIGTWFRGENWQWETPWDRNEVVRVTTLEFGIRKVSRDYQDIRAADIPVTLGKREACMVCHKHVGGFAPAHDPQALGCSSCHLGNPFTLDKTHAHEGMLLVPGNLSNARIACSSTDCHPEIIDRINRSLMTTNSGIVSVDRFVFGELPDPDGYAPIQDIGYSAADKHLRDLCANCHLGVEKTLPGPVDETSRGGGCTACHLNYTVKAEQQHLAYVQGGKKEELLPVLHPSLDLNVSNAACFGCHSRSGRISTNYEGWHETLLDEEQIPLEGTYRVLQDKRVFEYIADDIHHRGGMDCIDCHNSYEVMGDGIQYLHEEQAVKIRCEDCHSHTSRSLHYEKLDVESKKIFDLRQFAHKNRPMLQAKESGIALVNTYIQGTDAFLVGKNSGNIHPLKPPAEQCKAEYGHQSVSCSSCHTAWAPTCIGCHNTFEKDATGFDLLDQKFVEGEWVEYVGAFFAEAPTLGIREGETRQTEPAIPGMIMTIDKGGYPGEIPGEILFHRLFAPVAPHTTSSKGRSCTSCHTNPVAIGYGRGELSFEVVNGKGRWTFQPFYAPNANDGLPEDAWISFENPEQPGRSTRTDFRAFNQAEQKRILDVGICLQCHNEQSDIMKNSLKENFRNYLKKASDQCILPD